MKSKIKRMVCIACAFVTSFLLTVTAYSATLADGDVINSKFLGKYTNNSDDGYIWAKEGNIVIYTYKDDARDCYVTGSLSTYQLKNGNRGFYAHFPNVARVDENENVVMDNPTIENYSASGDVKNGFFNVKIASDQSSLTYVK